MKKVKSLIKRLIISYLIIFIALSSTASTQARMYDAQCGEFLSNYARDFIKKYCEGGNTQYSHVGFAASDGPHWSSGVFGKGTFKADCTNGVHYMYFKALGVDITKYGYGASDSAISHLNGSYSQYWEKIPLSAVKAGDVVLRSGHGELYIGNGQNANFGNSPRSGKIKSGPGNFTYAFRPKFDVNPTGSLGADAEEEDLNIYDANGFIYTGVPTISGYKNSAPFGKWIIKMLAEILDYLIGILTFGIRVVIVGWTAIVERVFIDGVVNAVTGVTDERVDDWKPTTDEEGNPLPSPGEETIEIGQGEEKPYQIGQEGEEGYVSEGVVAVGNVGGKIDLNPSSKANITVENIVYNKVPILDVNFFNFESAGGSVVDKDGIIYLLKTNVAMWYYIFRVMAITVMLLVLIYCGIKMALTTVAEKKAVYKQMLIDWLIGFFLVFAIGFIIYFIIDVNETFISWVIPKQENGEEIMLYETIRSKAYELKATSGFTGMIMYIVMVYYAVRFLIVYFKRYLTATILALMGPFMAVSYAIEKVNKGGRGAAKKYGDWLRDFSYTILMQSMHALIYTIFITTILKLTEVSLVGIVISFMFLGFMLKVDPIFRKIFGLTGGKNTGKLAIGDIGGQIAIAKAGGGAVKRVAKGYGNFAAGALKPVGAVAGKLSNKITDVNEQMEEERALSQGKTLEEYRREQEIEAQEKEKRRKERAKKLDQIVDGMKITGSMIKTGVLGVLVVPMLIADQKLAGTILGSTVTSSQRTKKLIEDAFKKGNWNAHAYTIDFGKRFKLAGIHPKNKKAQERLERQMKKRGYTYHLVDVPVSPDAVGGKPSLHTQAPKVGVPNVEDTRGDATTGGLPKAVFDRLTPNQKSMLLSAGTIGTLKFAHDLKDVKEVQEVLEEQGIEAAAAYAELLAEAEEQEKELERAYEEAVGELDKQIEEAERSGNEDLAKMVRQIKQDKVKNLAETMAIMKEPFNEKDIERAIKNYKSIVPQFNENAQYLSQQDIEGISKQIEKVLQSKGQDIELNKEFIGKVEKELKDKLAKDKQEQASRKQSIHIAGQDATRTMKDDIVEGTDLTLKEKIKALNTDDRGTNPNSTSNPNAPKAHSAGSVASSIRSASKGAVGKSSSAFSRGLNSRLAHTLDALDSINDRARKFTGGKDLYTKSSINDRLAHI